MVNWYYLFIDVEIMNIATLGEWTIQVIVMCEW